MMEQSEFGEIYRHGFVKTIRLLRNRGASAQQAEDVAQSAWLQGWRKLDQLRDNKLIVAWINAIAINFFRRHGKKESRYQGLSGFEICAGVGKESVSLDVEKILRICSPNDRGLFERQLSGSTTQEIADERGISPTATRLRFLRARRGVRAKLANDLARSSDQMVSQSSFLTKRQSVFGSL